jgi:hypothetical protein
MRPYGLPRICDLEYPDIGDIQLYGLKSSVGKFPGKNGDYRPYCRNHSKARRIWKKKERAAQRAFLNKLLKRCEAEL